MNEYFMIAVIFIIGILIIGIASFSLFNQTLELENKNKDLNVDLFITSENLSDINVDNQNLKTTISNKDAAIAKLTTQNNDLVVDNNTLLFNYNVSQEELMALRIEMEQNKIDLNQYDFDFNVLDDFFSIYDINVYDYNSLQDFNSSVVTDEDYIDLNIIFNSLKVDFKDCFWATNCTSDENACQDAYGAVIDANILETLFAASCAAISQSDYNSYMYFE